MSLAYDRRDHYWRPRKRVDPGDIVAERWRIIAADRSHEDRLHITRADPRALISDGMLRLIRMGQGHPDLVLDGDVLTINAENGRWIYRIGRYDPYIRAYYMEWPD